MLSRLPLFFLIENLAINVSASFTTTLDARRHFRNGAADILQPMLMVLRCALTELFAVGQCVRMRLPMGDSAIFITPLLSDQCNRSDRLIQSESLSPAKIYSNRCRYVIRMYRLICIYVSVLQCNVWHVDYDDLKA